MMNPLTRGRNRNKTSGYGGVSFNPVSQRWQAQITFRGSHHYLGLHDTAHEAHLAQARMAKQLAREEMFRD
jgi:hypothetical protein